MLGFMKKWFKGLVKKELENILYGKQLRPELREEGMEDKYLVDIRGSYAGLMGGHPVMGGASPAASRVATEPGESTPVKKMTVRPVDVLHELEKVPTPFSMVGIDVKISILKDKRELVRQHYAETDLKGAIERLENRKRYPEFKDFYDQFQNTTMESVDKLLEKHDLVMQPAELFIPELPAEAIAIMKEYTEKTDKLCLRAPLFFMIAPREMFQKVYEKRDPILLVQSPFGMYWQILGAWDEEMVLLSEL